MELQKLQEIEMMKHENTLAEIDRKGEWSMKEAEITSQRFAMAKDIDGDRVNDDIEIAQIKLAAEHEKNMHELKEEHSKQKLSLKEEQAKIDIKKAQIKTKTK